MDGNRQQQKDWYHQNDFPHGNPPIQSATFWNNNHVQHRYPYPARMQLPRQVHGPHLRPRHPPPLMGFTPPNYSAHNPTSDENNMSRNAHRRQRQRERQKEMKVQQKNGGQSCGYGDTQGYGSYGNCRRPGYNSLLEKVSEAGKKVTTEQTPKRFESSHGHPKSNKLKTPKRPIRHQEREAFSKTKTNPRSDSSKGGTQLDKDEAFSDATSVVSLIEKVSTAIDDHEGRLPVSEKQVRKEKEAAENIGHSTIKKLNNNFHSNEAYSERVSEWINNTDLQVSEEGKGTKKRPNYDQKRGAFSQDENIPRSDSPESLVSLSSKRSSQLDRDETCSDTSLLDKGCSALDDHQGKRTQPSEKRIDKRRSVRNQEWRKRQREMKKDKKFQTEDNKKQENTSTPKTQLEFTAVKIKHVFDILLREFSGRAKLNEIEKECKSYFRSYKQIDVLEWFRQHAKDWFRVFENEVLVRESVIVAHRKFLNICFSYMIKGNCNRENCPFIHICIDFLAKICQRKYCKYSHNVRDEHNSNILKKLSLDNYSEDEICSLLRAENPKTCPLYNSIVGCPDIGFITCPDVHICQAYICGKCTSVEKCALQLQHNIGSKPCAGTLLMYDLNCNTQGESVIKKSILVLSTGRSQYQDEPKKQMSENRKKSIDSKCSKKIAIKPLSNEQLVSKDDLTKTNKMKIGNNYSVISKEYKEKTKDESVLTYDRINNSDDSGLSKAMKEPRNRDSRTTEYMTYSIETKDSETPEGMKSPIETEVADATEHIKISNNAKDMETPEGMKSPRETEDEDATENIKSLSNAEHMEIPDMTNPSEREDLQTLEGIINPSESEDKQTLERMKTPLEVEYSETQETLKNASDVDLMKVEDLETTAFESGESVIITRCINANHTNSVPEKIKYVDPNIDEKKVLSEILLKFKGKSTINEIYGELTNLFPSMGIVQIFQWFKKRKVLFLLLINKCVPAESIVMALMRQLKLCVGYSEGFTGHSCACLHLCKDFVLGSCRGRKQRCPYSHDVRDSHNSGIFSKYGLDSNMFSDESLLCLVKCSTLSVCEEYMVQNGECEDYANNTCPSFHVCDRYVKGKCRVSDEKCKYGHNIKSSECIDTLKAYEMELLNVNVIRKIVLVPNVACRMRSAGSAIAQARIHDTENDIPICELYLKNQCEAGDQCQLHHYFSPYLWQIERDGMWVGLDFDDGFIRVEEQFCDNACEMELEVLDQEQVPPRMSIDFSDCRMIWKSHTEQGNIRRLSTESYVKHQYGKDRDKFANFYTRWIWYWQDDLGCWNKYHLNEPPYQDVLEAKYLHGDFYVYFEFEKNKYIIDLKKMIQTNLVYTTERKVRRRPMFINSDATETMNLVEDPAINCHYLPNNLPSGWSPMNTAVISSEICDRIPLHETQKEYISIENAFFKTMNQTEYIIEKIYKIQNLHHWLPFVRKKAYMEKQCHKHNVAFEQKNLFHGTDIETVELILRQSLDPRMYGKNGTMYGKGAYFATSAKYSNSYAKGGPEKFMFYANVLIGTTTVGNSSMQRPPPIDPRTPFELFDTCVDNLSSPSIFVVFERDQCYPEYLISYRSLITTSYNTSSPTSGMGVGSSSNPRVNNYNLYTSSSGFASSSNSGASNFSSSSHLHTSSSGVGSSSNSGGLNYSSSSHTGNSSYSSSSSGSGTYGSTKKEKSSCVVS